VIFQLLDSLGGCAENNIEVVIYAEMTFVIIQFFIYLDAYSAAQRPVIKQERTSGGNTCTQTKQCNLYHSDNIINSVSAITPIIMP
jgi:hypothetical protein